MAGALGVPQLEAGKRFEIGNGWVSIDGFFDGGGRVTLVEVNAHVGAMKTATKNKVLKDTLKLTVISAINAEAWREKKVRRVLVFLDDRARASFGPKSWANAAFDLVAVETHVCQLNDQQRAALELAQSRQDLRNNG